MDHSVQKQTPLAYSPENAARLMGMGRTKIFALLKDGTLKGFKCGSRRLITLDAIKECLQMLEAQ